MAIRAPDGANKGKVVTITISRATFSENEGQTLPGGNHGRSGVQGKRDYFKGRLA